MTPDGYVYYHNKVTKITQWERPRELDQTSQQVRDRCRALPRVVLLMLLPCWMYRLSAQTMDVNHICGSKWDSSDRMDVVGAVVS